MFALGCGTEEAPWTGFETLLLGAAGDGAVPVAPAPAGTTGPVDSQPGAPLAGQGSPLPEAGAATGPLAGNSAPSGAGVAGPGAAPVAGASEVYRVTELMLRDPHLFAGGLSDITEAPVLGQSVNRILIPNALTKDEDGDGLLDVSILLQLPPLASLAVTPGASLGLIAGSCPLATPTACTRAADAPVEPLRPIEHRAEGSCLEPTTGTTGSFTPAIVAPAAPCFVTPAGADMVLDLGGVKIAVTAVRVAAQLESAKLVSGLLAGFVTSAAAMQAVLPSNAGSMFAGQSFASFVRRQDYDLAESPTMQDGFWMYLNFTATPVQYTP